MVATISLDDRNAWDDTALIDSWDEALEEYKKYYSIQAQGKRLEDALTEEELTALKEEHGDLIEAAETKPNAADVNIKMEVEEPIAHQTSHHVMQAETPSPSGQQTQPTTMASHDQGPAQAILGTVQDDNLKSLMMSWYYAGYYTGLYEGQQKKAS